MQQNVLQRCVNIGRWEEFAHLRSHKRGKNRNRGYSYLNEACRDAGAGRDDGLETAVVHHEVANCNKKYAFHYDRRNFRRTN